MLYDRVRATIDQYAMWNPGDTVLVAVSGGVDSVVLLDLLERLAAENQLSLHVAHLDHGLRDTSSADAEFVADIARDRGLPIHRSHLSPGALSDSRKQGLEEAARNARYAFLQQVASEIGAHGIALGHTASDQAETVLHRLARGTGITGLCGIPPVRRPFIRPLIDLTRAEILAYAGQHDLRWRTDASNLDLSFTRNRIRHRVIPELERINPAAVESICRASRHAVEAEQTSRFLVSTLWDAVCSSEDEQRIALRRSVLLTYPSAVRNLLLREGARRVRGELVGLDRDHVEAIAQLVASTSSHGELSLPDLHVYAQADELLLVPGDTPSIEPWSIPIGLGETELPEPPIALHLRIVEGDRPNIRSSDRWSEVADADRIAFPLELRSRRIGDRFTPLGMATTLKLKDFLINEHVPYYNRGQLALLCDQEKIIWVVGVRLSNDVRITSATRRCLLMHGRSTR